MTILLLRFLAENGYSFQCCTCLAGHFDLKEKCPCCNGTHFRDLRKILFSGIIEVVQQLKAQKEAQTQEKKS